MKYYWLKLKRDFFKRHDIRIIEAMPNGKEYIIFYLKLLCESVDHEGKLRFSDQIPYSAEMLAVITDTNTDTVKAAVEIFTGLGMMELMDDGTYYMSECEKMIGYETEWAEKKRAYRERIVEDETRTLSSTCPQPVLIESDKSKRKSKSIEKEKKENIKEKEFDELWKLYPRKEGRQNALKAYLKARSEGIDKETIRDGIERYKAFIQASRTEERYILHGSTWFNQRRWEDEYGEGKADYERPRQSYEEVYE